MISRKLESWHFAKRQGRLTKALIVPIIRVRYWKTIVLMILGSELAIKVSNSFN